jgi:hypothetical protein
MKNAHHGARLRIFEHQRLPLIKIKRGNAKLTTPTYVNAEEAIPPALPSGCEESYHDPESPQEDSLSFLTRVPTASSPDTEQETSLVCLTRSHAKIVESKQNSTIVEKK